MNAAPTVFALTGGIGSGKSTVADIWRWSGLPVVDADLLAREVVAPGQPGLTRLRERFGPRILASDGTLNRGALARLVFSDSAARRELDAILHPLIRQAAEEQFAQLQAAGHSLIAYDVPLLFETGQADRYRPVVVVFADEEARRERVGLRDGADAEQIRRRMSAQWPLEQKVADADYVIDNNHSLEETERQAKEVLERVRTALRSSAPSPP